MSKPRMSAVSALAIAMGLTAVLAPAEAAFRPGGGGGGGRFGGSLPGGGMFHGGGTPAFHTGATPAFHGGSTFQTGTTPAFHTFHGVGAFPGAFTLHHNFAGLAPSGNLIFVHRHAFDLNGGRRAFDFDRDRRLFDFDRGRHAFDFDRDHRDFDFRHRHRRFFFAGGPYFVSDYGPYDCSPYWNGYRWVYPYGYGYSCGYGT